MSRVELAPELAEAIDRIFEYLAQYEVENIAARIQEIIQAIAVLEQNPLIGRTAQGCGNRELVIGRQSRGYVALYRYIEALDTVFVLALRGKHEAGYARGVMPAGA